TGFGTVGRFVRLRVGNSRCWSACHNIRCRGCVGHEGCATCKEDGQYTMTAPEKPNKSTGSPILPQKYHRSASVFTPEALLREARRQKGIAAIDVPEVCILDPDGDIVRHLVATSRAHRSSTWPCYHTELYIFEDDDWVYGIVGCAVGAAFAVLV